MNSQTKGIISLLLSGAMYGSFGILIQWMGSEMSVINQIIFRYFLAVVLILSLLAITKPRLKVPKKSWPVLLVFAIITQVSIWSFTKGAVLTSIPSLLGSFYIGSIVSGTMLGLLVFHEKLALKNWVGTFMAILGLYVLSQNFVGNRGILYGLVAGSLECLTQAIRKYLGGVSKGAILLASLLGVLAMSLISALISGYSFYLPQLTTTWIGGSIFAVLVGVVNITVTYGFRLLPMNVGSVIMSGEIFFGALFSTLFLSTKPTGTELFASIVVLLSIVVQNWVIREDTKLVLLIRKMLEN